MWCSLKIAILIIIIIIIGAVSKFLSSHYIGDITVNSVTES